MKKAANGRSSIYKDADAWHGWVSFGEDATGRRRRKHVRAQTMASVAEKVAQLPTLSFAKRFPNSCQGESGRCA
jgi:hypothetical protein